MSIAAVSVGTVAKDSRLQTRLDKNEFGSTSWTRKDGEIYQINMRLI